MDGTVLPELTESDFLNEVLLVPTSNTETFLEGLIAKATSLGIPTSRSSSVLSITGKASTFSTSGAESHVTIDTSHARTASTGSKGSASTRLTSTSSEDGIQEITNNVLMRKRSRILTFAQYEKYLAQVNPNLNQPKFLALPTTERASSTPSLFSVSTRKSYIGLRNGLSKMRRRNKSTPQLPMSVAMFVPLFLRIFHCAHQLTHILQLLQRMPR
jgi:hypothetical protein